MVSVTVTDELSGQTGAARLAIDGEVAAELHEDLEAILESYVVDDDTDEDSPKDAAPAATVPVLSGDLAEAKQTFAAVLGAEDRLRVEHPDDAPRLLECARAGQDALSADPDGALEHYDALSDLMFETGIFL